ncbi:MAG: type II secretion system protein [Candidatus Riflebacteria bacterium]|nr:type II secretion system protein [Candidatus Riflebacteria bacterium]
MARVDTEHASVTGNSFSGIRVIRGFTLIEMSVVVAIIGILYMSVVPMYGNTIARARETALKENLQTMRRVLDQYYKNHQRWPDALSNLVSEGYLRAVPVDPITTKADWVEVPSEPGITDVFDVHSAAPGKGLDGQAYASW